MDAAVFSEMAKDCSISVFDAKRVESFSSKARPASEPISTTNLWPDSSKSSVKAKS